MVKGLRRELLAKAGVYAETNRVHLRMAYARDPKNPTLSLQQFEKGERPRRLGTLKADKKAGDTIQASDLNTPPAVQAQNIAAIVVRNWFPNVEPRLSVPRPLGYVIPARHADIIENLLRLGISVMMFTRDQILDVEAYTAEEVVPAKYDYLPPDKIEVTKSALRLPARRGDYFVSGVQAAANLIPILLEPQSDFGLIRYGVYKLVPASGDLWAFYRLTKTQDLPVVPYKDWRD